MNPPTDFLLPLQHSPTLDREILLVVSASAEEEYLPMSSPSMEYCNTGSLLYTKRVVFNVLEMFNAF